MRDVMPASAARGKLELAAAPAVVKAVLMMSASDRTVVAHLLVML